ncbi:MAG TPA: hypothetical protein VFC63_06695 [Blastocatellia bacterium]|nr:hypothetical protein [Blastocatellia bacterium]
MNYRDFNAIAAELREGDKLLLELSSGESIKAELTGSVVLGSPARNGEVTVTADGQERRFSHKDLNLIDLTIE